MQLDAITLGAGDQLDLHPGVAQRVGQQVVERPSDHHFIDRDRDVGESFDADPLALGGRSPAGPIRGSLQQLEHGDAAASQDQLVVLGSRQRKQVIGQPTEPVSLLDRRADRTAQRAPGRLLASDQLELGSQHGQRASQLVAGIGDERPLARDGGVDPGQHLVQSAPEPAELVIGAGPGQAV